MEVGQLVYNKNSALFYRVIKILNGKVLAVEVASNNVIEEFVENLDIIRDGFGVASETLVERRKSLLENLHSLKSKPKCLLKLIHMLEHPIYHEWFWKTVTEAVDDPKLISYPVFYEQIDNDKSRRKCSMYKFLSNIANCKGLNLSSKARNLISQLFGDEITDPKKYEFELVSGKAIEEMYLKFKDVEGLASCMTIEGYGRMTQLYSANPDKVQLVLIKNNNNLIGRSLLWTTDQGVKVLDRVYPSDKGPQTNAAHHWARKNNYDYKIKQSYGAGYLKSRRSDYTITLKNNCKVFPYIDTFFYCNVNPRNSDKIVLSLSRKTYSFKDTVGRVYKRKEGWI